MKFNVSIRRRKFIIDSICYMFVLLFVYAGTSKVLDYENFSIQLGQSPLLSPFAGIIAWAVPAIEFLIALLLLIAQFRLTAMFSAFTLMVLFTAYIYIILNYSEFVPCSCGGVLEKMSWTQHLIFNLAFILLAAIAVMLYPAHNMVFTDKNQVK